MILCSIEGFASALRKEPPPAASLPFVPGLEAAVMVGAARPRSSRATPVRPSLRVIPGGAVSPARLIPSRPSPIFAQPGPELGFFSAFALALVPCLAFWAVLAFGVYFLVT